MAIDEHARTNLAWWEQCVPVHAASRLYDLQSLVDDPERLSPVVAYDAPHLGDLSGIDAVHLQCHIGTDTISLARLGARATGLDLSPAALAVARDLVRNAGVDVTFVESELYDAPTALGDHRFDLVYTGTGALNWLPDVRRWAMVVAELLRPGGRLYIREGHPMLWSLDDVGEDGVLKVHYPYFETAEPAILDEEGTYADGDTSHFEHTVTHEWNHGLGEIVQAVIDAGLTVTRLDEHAECGWDAIPGLTEPASDGHHRLREKYRDLVPLMYTLEARVPAD